MTVLQIDENCRDAHAGDCSKRTERESKQPVKCAMNKLLRKHNEGESGQPHIVTMYG